MESRDRKLMETLRQGNGTPRKDEEDHLSLRPETLDSLFGKFFV